MIKKVRSHNTQNEPPIFERSSPGKVAYQLPELDVPPVDAGEALGVANVRSGIEDFPEVSEVEAIRHFTRLSTYNYAIDHGLYPLGSCTMKLNATSEMVLVPSYFTRRPLLFYGYGSITLIYDCQLTEQRREEMEMLEDEIVAITRALGDKTRLRLLWWIVREPQAYGSKLAKLCQVSQSSVSRHLRILKDAGILEERPAENHITYEVSRHRIESLAPQLITYLYEEE